MFDLFFVILKIFKKPETKPSLFDTTYMKGV